MDENKFSHFHTIGEKGLYCYGCVNKGNDVCDACWCGSGYKTIFEEDLKYKTTFKKEEELKKTLDNISDLFLQLSKEINKLKELK